MSTSAGTANSTCQSSVFFDSVSPNRNSEPEYVYSPFGVSPNQFHEYMRLRSELDTTASPILISGLCALAGGAIKPSAHMTPNALRICISPRTRKSKGHTTLWRRCRTRLRRFRPVFEFMTADLLSDQRQECLAKIERYGPVRVGQLVRSDDFRQRTPERERARRSCRTGSDSDKCVTVVSGRSARSSRRARG